MFFRKKSRSQQLWRLRFGALNPPLGGEINRKTAEPMSAFVMLTGHGRQSRSTMSVGRRSKRGSAWIVRRQRGNNSLQHPPPAQIQSVKMAKFGIASIG